MIKELWLLSCFQIPLRPKNIPAAWSPRLPRGKSATSQTRRLLQVGPLSALCLKTNRKLWQHSQTFRPPSTAPASLRLWTSQLFTSTAALPAQRPYLCTVCSRRPLLSRHLTHSPWGQSVNSATARVHLSLLGTSAPLWSPSLQERPGHRSPLAPVLFREAIRTRCSGGFSPSRHQCPVERHLPSRAPCKSTAKSSRGRPQRASVRHLSN